MLFVGLTRFSLFMPNSGAWVASNGSRLTEEEYLAHLYDDERLGLRCDVFFNFTLPMMALAVENHRVRHVITFSSNLPTRYKEQVQAAAESYPFVVLDEVPVGGTPVDIGVFAQQEVERVGWGDQPMGLYRLDDDDVLSVDFFDQMTPHITPEHLGWVVTLASGITAIYERGRFFLVRGAVFPLHSKGHLSVCGWRDGEFVRAPEAAHTKSDRVGPVILDSRKLSHLWVRSTTQDGALYRMEMSREVQLQKMIEEFRKFEVVSQEAIAEAFPLMQYSFTSEPPTV
ncbi:glycosyltransferase [Tessaracoccus sp. ZS01]|uniref:glycosyltransferase n=1 Tax=Tessaracoccus sp. ZS01 TaxID=1906324 RepID=UPI00096EDBE0|nr:glycosyltransferase [Tessaracoccus sp. ZS01]MCG6568035.1 hypothetical protein [Tessaracoccus sp. ZS01]OMG54295.1 hypothetical protein BJN44_10470 [Tessaracoccus sp. ZS01]